VTKGTGFGGEERNEGSQTVNRSVRGWGRHLDTPGREIGHLGGAKGGFIKSKSKRDGGSPSGAGKEILLKEQGRAEGYETEKCCIEFFERIGRDEEAAG